MPKKKPSQSKLTEITRTAMENLQAVRTLKPLFPIIYPDHWKRQTFTEDKHWKLTAEYASMKKKPTELRYVTVTVYPAISRREMQKAEQAVLTLTRQAKRPASGNAALSNTMKDTLRCLFETAGLPTSHSRQQSQAAIVRVIEGHLAGRVSRQIIQREYRRWLDRQGFPKKQYWIEENRLS